MSDAIEDQQKIISKGQNWFGDVMCKELNIHLGRYRFLT
jgi:hypothetical protein